MHFISRQRMRCAFVFKKALVMNGWTFLEFALGPLPSFTFSLCLSSSFFIAIFLLCLPSSFAVLSSLSSLPHLHQSVFSSLFLYVSHPRKTETYRKLRIGGFKAKGGDKRVKNTEEKTENKTHKRRNTERKKSLRNPDKTFQKLNSNNIRFPPAKHLLSTMSCKWAIKRL